MAAGNCHNDDNPNCFVTTVSLQMILEYVFTILNIRIIYVPINCISFSDVCEPTRAKVSYELAERLLAADEEAKAQLNKDIEGLCYTEVRAPPDRKPGKSLKLK